MHYRTDPTTLCNLTVDRVTRSFSMSTSRHYYLLRTLRSDVLWASGRLVLLLEGITPPQQVEEKGVPWHKPNLKDRRCRCIENQEGTKSNRKIRRNGSKIGCFASHSHTSRLARRKLVENLQPTGSRHRRKQNDNNACKRQQNKALPTAPRVKIRPPAWGQVIHRTRLCSMGQVRLLCRLTIGWLLHSQCVRVGIIISPECSAQMWRMITPLPRRNDASSTNRGERGYHDTSPPAALVHIFLLSRDQHETLN